MVGGCRGLVGGRVFDELPQPVSHYADGDRIDVRTAARMCRTIGGPAIASWVRK